MLGLLAVFTSIVYYREEVLYGLRQAKGQLKIIFNIVSVEEMLEDPGIPDSDKTKIRMIGEIADFAERRLGLEAEKNYTTFYDQGNLELMWVVTACHPFRLEAYEWKFPLFGKFSYKGFFEKESAEKEENDLKKMGLDTDIGNTSGWSTLGILKDPILSGMLARNERGLAELIIHELTHATIFVKNNIDYNENLASFVATYGALLYLEEKYGEDARICDTFRQRMDDRRKYDEYILRSCRLLDSLYIDFDEGMPEEKKRELKDELISGIVANIDTVSFSPPYKEAGFFAGENPNNTYFMEFRRYRGMQSKLEEELNSEFNGNIVQYIDNLKDRN